MEADIGCSWVQVYRGTLADSLGGGEVAVKVQRPGVREAVGLDLHLMRIVAKQLQVQMEVLPSPTTMFLS